MDLIDFDLLTKVGISNESYLYVTKETIESVTIVSDYIESLYDLDFMYERFVGRYPSNNVPTKKDFLILLQKNNKYSG